MNEVIVILMIRPGLECEINKGSLIERITMRSKSTGEPADRLCADECPGANHIWLASALREPKSPRLNTKQRTISQHASTVPTLPPLPSRHRPRCQQHDVHVGNINGWWRNDEVDPGEGDYADQACWDTVRDNR